MIHDVIADAKERMDKAIEALRHDLMTIRTGRASPALVEHIPVDYYGVPTPLQQLATISVPEAQQILIRPYTRGDIPAIEKAIAKSDLGLTPTNDGQVIRLTIPPLNEERRRELTKLVNKRGEEARVAIRNIRRDANKDLAELEKESLISEDERKRAEEKIQELTDQHIRRVDEIVKEKDAEIMTV
ncbi:MULTISPECIES: ribosome recycling factor [Caldilinea]|jgi:ribosome recycling factor|uniref:Ribosome-recycling factor n=1 Tax=Caldilinea aerophila (strain DSM 14535 / JCM 11387 / NBRC 104270 / STL-6-O1) TaxID=926550 RepID=I0IA65_CALAS|nr:MULTISPECIES: ribosome recycling factor [Caldilinea]MBO9391327.1 ribosome recycling factor [Caldilinea sp.]BAM02153.1 ribosome-recycling factor [Caldilinea aerophila DSM 14535 = NBRC 104270]GIV75352.1 MAG: ribosome-recycling factor [Caldilinea sp.]